MPDSVNRDCIEFCTRILDGSITGEKTDNPFGGVSYAASYGAVRIVYTPDLVK